MHSPPSFLHHALQMATYLLNILPPKTLSNMSPTQLLHHCDPFYKHLRVFGCLCYPLFPSPTTKKLQPQSTLCAFLGYHLNYRGYICFDLSDKKCNSITACHFWRNTISFCLYVVVTYLYLWQFHWWHSLIPCSYLGQPWLEAFVHNLYLTGSLQAYLIIHLAHQPPPPSYLLLIVQTNLDFLQTLLLGLWPPVAWSVSTNLESSLTFLFPLPTL